jgi:hypothetical protein
LNNVRILLISFYDLPKNSDRIPFKKKIELCPALEKYVEGQELDEMEKAEWIIELTFEEVKAMFDPVIERIISLIRKQLDKLDGDISAMLLVGGFSESKYLQLSIKQEFSNGQRNISVPSQPIAAIMKGGEYF